MTEPVSALDLPPDQLDIARATTAAIITIAEQLEARGAPISHLINLLIRVEARLRLEAMHKRQAADG